MNKQQYDNLQGSISLISSFNLKNKKDRTLIWGYDLERNSFHFYLKNGLFHLIVYTNNDKIIRKKINLESIHYTDCLPSKRAYPEACDFEFCSLLKSFGADISFTVFDEKRESEIFYGEVMEDFEKEG